MPATRPVAREVPERPIASSPAGVVSTASGAGSIAGVAVPTTQNLTTATNQEVKQTISTPQEVKQTISTPQGNLQVVFKNQFVNGSFKLVPVAISQNQQFSQTFTQSGGLTTTGVFEYQIQNGQLVTVPVSGNIIYQSPAGIQAQGDIATLQNYLQGTEIALRNIQENFPAQSQIPLLQQREHFQFQLQQAQQTLASNQPVTLGTISNGNIQLTGATVPISVSGSIGGQNQSLGTFIYSPQVTAGNQVSLSFQGFVPSNVTNTTSQIINGQRVGFTQGGQTTFNQATGQIGIQFPSFGGQQFPNFSLYQSNQPSTATISLGSIGGIPATSNVTVTPAGAYQTFQPIANTYYTTDTATGITTKYQVSPTAITPLSTTFPLLIAGKQTIVQETYNFGGLNTFKFGETQPQGVTLNTVETSTLPFTSVSIPTTVANGALTGNQVTFLNPLTGVASGYVTDFKFSATGGTALIGGTNIGATGQPTAFFENINPQTGTITTSLPASFQIGQFQQGIQSQIASGDITKSFTIQGLSYNPQTIPSLTFTQQVSNLQNASQGFVTTSLAPLQKTLESQGTLGSFAFGGIKGIGELAFVSPIAIINPSTYLALGVQAKNIAFSPVETLSNLQSGLIKTIANPELIGSGIITLETIGLGSAGLFKASSLPLKLTNEEGATFIFNKAQLTDKSGQVITRGFNVEDLKGLFGKEAEIPKPEIFFTEQGQFGNAESVAFKSFQTTEPSILITAVSRTSVESISTESETSIFGGFTRTQVYKVELPTSKISPTSQFGLIPSGGVFPKQIKTTLLSEDITSAPRANIAIEEQSKKILGKGVVNLPAEASKSQVITSIFSTGEAFVLKPLQGAEKSETFVGKSINIGKQGLKANPIQLVDVNNLPTLEEFYSNKPIGNLGRGFTGKVFEEPKDFSKVFSTERYTQELPKTLNKIYPKEEVKPILQNINSAKTSENLVSLEQTKQISKSVAIPDVGKVLEQIESSLTEVEGYTSKTPSLLLINEIPLQRIGNISKLIQPKFSFEKITTSLSAKSTLKQNNILKPTQASSDLLKQPISNIAKQSQSEFTKVAESQTQKQPQKEEQKEVTNQIQKQVSKGIPPSPDFFRGIEGGRITGLPSKKETKSKKEKQSTTKTIFGYVPDITSETLGIYSNAVNKKFGLFRPIRKGGKK